MSFYFQKNAISTVTQFEALVASANNAPVLLYKLVVTGPKYEGYISNCGGIKEVMLYKVPTHPYRFYYCDVLPTKISSVQKPLTGYHHQFFLTRQDAEDAFLEMQKQSVAVLKGRLKYYQDLLNTVRQMSV